MDYIYSFIPERIRSIPTHMDFDGQRRAEKYFQIIIILFAAVGFVWGYITQMFSQTLYILFAGVIFSSVDFDGQRRAEKYFQIIIILFAAVGFVWGYITQMVSQTLYILFAGVIFSSVLTLIPWGMYRRRPLKWQPAQDKDVNTVARPAAPAVHSQSKPKKKKLKD